MFLLHIPTLFSILIVIFASSIISVTLYFVLYSFWSGEVSQDTKTTADNIAMRIGVVYSVVIGMMLTNVRVEHVQMVQAIESEASTLVRLYHAIEREGGEDSAKIKKKIVDYVRFIVNEQWPALREAKGQSEDQIITGGLLLDSIWEYVVRAEKRTKNSSLRRLLDELEHYRALRLFDTQGSQLPIFWYIAIFGYLASMLPLFVHKPNLRRCVLISLYSGMVAVVLLGVFILSHPYSTAAGIEPDIFNQLIEASASSAQKP